MKPINAWYEFYRRELREPTLEEFIALGYDKETYIYTKIEFRKWEEEDDYTGNFFRIR